MRLIKASIVLSVAAVWLVVTPFCLADSSVDSASPNDAPKDRAAEKLEASARMAARIDAQFEQMWALDHTEPAPITNDGAFLRRASLDLNGVIPRAAEVREFVADNRPDKRVQLVDQLLASPRYSTHMATNWRNRIIPVNNDVNRGPQAIALQKWLRTRFAKNLRYDNLVGELLLTLGGDELGPALYYQANDVSPEKLATNTAELFLGIHLQCAQCHDHPTASWKQTDFWGLAAFFARVKVPESRNNPMQMSYRLVDADSGEVRLPESNEVVPPKYPGGDLAAAEERRTRRLQLALWLTSRDNDYFSRAAVNWAWSQLFGRGLVDTLDDTNAETGNAQLLNELATYFVESGYDLKNLWRTLAITKVYQLSAGKVEPNAEPPKHFERMLAKPLTPEQLYDSFALLTPLAAKADAYGPEANLPPGMLLEDPQRADFVRRMRPPPGSATEYRAGTLQALLMMNGRAMTEITAAGGSNLLGAVSAPFLNDGERIDALFLSTLARQPDDNEQAMCLAALEDCKDQPERDRALSDVLWALLNSTEFAFNQ